MKTYKCPYCDYRDNRDDLIEHIETHEDLIPKDFTPARLVFNIVNKREFGTCVVCKKATSWSEGSCKYDRLCSNPKCKTTLREDYKKNMIRVFNKTTLLGDAQHQQKMLANRKISGTYTFADGGKRTYTGKYELKTLEFFDKVLNCKSDDIMSPGPVFEYEFDGSKLKWITDILYIPFNLVIEVKDGGDNPNNRQMDTYRAKQVSKETMITGLGTFNYLRLTNNRFEQLIEVLAELKHQMIDDSSENKKAIIKINEMSMPGGMAVGSGDGYVVAYGYKNVLSGNDIEGFALSNDISSDRILKIDDEGHLRSESSSFLDDRKVSVYKYIGESSKYKELLEKVKDPYAVYKNQFIYEWLSGGETMLTKDQIQYSDNFKEVNIEGIVSRTTTEASTIIQEYNKITNTALPYISAMNPDVIAIRNKIVKTYKDLDILEDVNGYFVYNTVSKTRSVSYKNITESIVEGVINHGNI